MSFVLRDEGRGHHPPTAPFGGHVFIVIMNTSNRFRTAVPSRKQTTQILRSLSQTRDCCRTIDIKDLFGAGNTYSYSDPNVPLVRGQTAKQTSILSTNTQYYYYYYCFLPLFYCRGISSTPELLWSLSCDHGLHCIGR